MVERFREQHKALTPELLDVILSSWLSYVQSKVSKGLPNSEKPTPGAEQEAWPNLVARFQDKSWKQDCLKRDEKFEMHFTAAVRDICPEACIPY